MPFNLPLPPLVIPTVLPKPLCQDCDVARDRELEFMAPFLENWLGLAIPAWFQLAYEEGEMQTDGNVLTVSDTVPLELHQSPMTQGREVILCSWHLTACGSEQHQGGGEGHKILAETAPSCPRPSQMHLRSQRGGGEGDRE